VRSLTEKFNELRGLLKHGLGSIRPTGFDPVFYLIFPPAQIVEVKQRLAQWEAQLGIDGFEVHRLSMVDVINGYLRKHDLRDGWVEAAKLNFEDDEVVNQSLTSHLVQDDVLPRAVLAMLDSLKGRASAMLMLTDLEALHPFLRIGAVEQKLAGKFQVPTVVLYPGVAGGAYSRRFLGIHKEDGNYRSPHVD
jgi:hypothetical protein